MNDRQNPYGQDAEPYGYDEYGRPLYHPPSGGPFPPSYDGYDYGTAQQPSVPPQGYDPAYDAFAYGTGQQPPAQPGYDPATTQQPPLRGGFDPGTGQQAAVLADYGPGTGQQPPVQAGFDPGTGQQAAVPPGPGDGAPPSPSPTPPAQGAAPGEEYHTGQFAFVDEPDEVSDDVIDWLKFSESRTERREEAKRRGRLRRRLLVLSLILAVIGGTGYLWVTDRLPFVSGTDDGTAATPEAQVRDVIVVHLRETGGDTTSTALLVANETTGQGTTLLLPNELAVTPDGGTTTLGEAVTESSAGEVRDSVGSLLGADIKGTWRLDTPYLELLVNVIGGITLDTNAEVPGEDAEDGGEPLVRQGDGVPLDGQAAVAYAVHRGAEEPESAQLERFGQVMAAVLEQLPTGASAVAEVFGAMTYIADPSLPKEELAASLAQLAGYRQADTYATTPLPVAPDGTLSDDTANGLVRDVLGGTVSNAEPGGAPRVGIRDASGGDTAESARISLVNGGFTVVDARTADRTQAASQVTYRDEIHRETAMEAASTLGLPEEAVSQGRTAGNADVTIVLGADYQE